MMAFEHSFLQSKHRSKTLGKISLGYEPSWDHFDLFHLFPIDYYEDGLKSIQDWESILRIIIGKRNKKLISTVDEIFADEFLRNAIVFELGNFFISSKRIPDFLAVFENEQRGLVKIGPKSEGIYKKLRSIGVSDSKTSYIISEYLTVTGLFKSSSGSSSKYYKFYNLFGEAISGKCRLIHAGEGFWKTSKKTNVVGWYLYRIKRLLEIKLEMKSGVGSLIVPLATSMSPDLTTMESVQGKFRDDRIDRTALEKMFKEDYREICWRMNPKFGTYLWTSGWSRVHAYANNRKNPVPNQYLLAD
jgi:hypothetical protein